MPIKRIQTKPKKNLRSLSPPPFPSREPLYAGYNVDGFVDFWFKISLARKRV